MTDLHTHILPQMDDGAGSVKESLQMLRMEKQQGVDTVVLTPHFYPQHETASDFLNRRQQAVEKLMQALPADSPRLILGAEVAWFPNIMEDPDLEKLCLEGSKYLLLELPYESWGENVLDGVYQFACLSGLTPILAHVDRYLPLQKKRQVETLLAMGIPMQMSAAVMQKPFRRRKAVGLMKQGIWYLGSDCHNTDRRPPCMADAVPYLQRHLGTVRLREILNWPE